MLDSTKCLTADCRWNISKF